MPGPKRDDADWYAVEIANYILGGGGFASRLMQEVRDKNGLTYGIDTGLSPMEHGGLIAGKASTDNPKTAKALDVTLQTMKQFYEQGVTDSDIQKAKDFLTGSLPLALTSTDKIAGALVGLQLNHLGRDYLDRHSDYVRAVTTDDVNKAIHRWFNPASLSLSMVGKPDGLEPTQTRELVRD
jgi:zinc protease